MSYAVIHNWRTTFIRWSSDINDWWQVKYPYLSNCVHADNLVVIRWLTRIGYTVSPAVFYRSGEPFRNFYHVQSYSGANSAEHRVIRDASEGSEQGSGTAVRDWAPAIRSD